MTPIYEGTTPIHFMYNNTTALSAVYVGTIQIYPSTSIPTPYYWVDTSDITGLSSGQVINTSSLINKGNGGAITTTTTGNPTYQTGGQNNKPYILLNNQNLKVTTFNFFYKTYTIFIVAKQMNTGVLYSFGSAYSVPFCHYIYSQNASWFQNGSSGGTVALSLNNPSNSWLIKPNAMIFCETYNWVTAITLPEVKINNVVISNFIKDNLFNPVLPSGTNTNIDFYIASQATSSFGNMNFYEFLYYPRVLTSTEQQQVYSYLSGKYNIV